MALRRVRGAFSNPRALKTALDLRKKGASKEQIIAALHKKYFPKYTLEEITKIYSPKGGWSKRLVELVDQPNLMPKRQILATAMRIREGGTASVSRMNSDPTKKKSISQAASRAMKEIHTNGAHMEKLKQGIEGHWKRRRLELFIKNPKLRQTLFIFYALLIKEQKEAAEKKLAAREVGKQRLFQLNTSSVNKVPQFQARLSELSGKLGERIKQTAGIRRDLETRSVVIDGRLDANHQQVGDEWIKKGKDTIRVNVLATNQTPFLALSSKVHQEAIGNIFKVLLTSNEQNVLLMKAGILGKYSDARIMKDLRISRLDFHNLLESSLKKLSESRELKELLKQAI